MSRHIVPDQVDQVAQVLSEAFFDDPMFTYILPDPVQRIEPLKWFFKAGIRYGSNYGEVYTTDQEYGGAIWLIPNNTTVTFFGMLRSGMLTAPVRLGWSAFGRFLTLTSATEVAHKRLLSAPHYYLLALGVAPEKQRQGIGSNLIQPILLRADQENIPCYLETEREDNVPFYERHGFRVAYTGTVAPDGPSFRAMVREPQSSRIHTHSRVDHPHLIEGVPYV